MNFDLEAKSWDDDKRVTRAKLISEEIDRWLGDKINNNAMEFGCGTGLITLNLKNKFKDIMMVDNSAGMIEEVNKKIKNQNVNNIRTWCGDIDEIDDKNKYDAIYTSMTLHHIVNISKVLEKLHSLLSLEGELYIVDLVEEDGTFHSSEKGFEGHNGFNQNNLIETLKNIGFKDIRNKVFYKGSKSIEERNVDYELFIMVARK
ncbi:methyltransferase domain protein [Clostridium argentinense CDC 2741]|uniref:Methyltransferase domain protein n=1 Tax=Clostridium argentinense CDC 2741 TaxID=1418104 RepID=A0A0C1R1X9_9CLOT|nr:class I SAM-dependent methyltransferase [Clostridium argentinense]ARC86304.1 SAM-dependent methyltransferase [Clostridium argentinense]KIE44446.1 methyltransferase domain protein [Clostridium argentinense CDC 2741]NFF40636.1 class I SAM-dependent methyltransferase [Clostridium argentinense]NFP51125.1 class I SAM-dependent methyltransferase [Clostridium argentinense]NFP73277.1 class I SAM-dependent methyltransferase [Clostridium argentinense]